MLGLLMLIGALMSLPRIAAVAVAAFVLVYAVKIVVEDLKDPDVPDSRKAVIVLVAGLTLHVLVFHRDVIPFLAFH